MTESPAFNVDVHFSWFGDHDSRNADGVPLVLLTQRVLHNCCHHDISVTSDFPRSRVVMHPRNVYARAPDFLGLARRYPPLRPQYVLTFRTRNNPIIMTAACS
jgi:hypothetical protein